MRDFGAFISTSFSQLEFSPKESASCSETVHALFLCSLRSKFHISLPKLALGSNHAAKMFSVKDASLPSFLSAYPRRDLSDLYYYYSLAIAWCALHTTTLHKTEFPPLGSRANIFTTDTLPKPSSLTEEANDSDVNVKERADSTWEGEIVRSSDIKTRDNRCFSCLNLQPLHHQRQLSLVIFKLASVVSIPTWCST